MGAAREGDCEGRGRERGAKERVLLFKNCDPGVGKIELGDLTSRQGPISFI